jgi:SAM-dependent methyltransferase
MVSGDEGVKNLSELTRLLQLVPYRLPRLWRFLTRTGTPQWESRTADIFDLLHGVETEKTVKIYKLDAVSRSYIHSHGYEAYCPNLLADILASIPIRREQYEFVDIGCGKGRALIVADEIGFQRGTGVELSPSLCEVAQRNLAKCGIKGRVICQDALTFALPTSPCVIYLYNPFRAPIMNRLVKNIEKRLENSKSDLWVVYVSPDSGKVFDRSKALRFDRTVANAAIYHAAS